jgi:hypothetical protein
MGHDMRREIPDFKARSARHQAELGEEGALRLLDAGRAWDLAPTLQAGGAIIFPHATLTVCGHQIAAAVHACLDSGAQRVLAIGVLHALTQELEEARTHVANGGDVTREPAWGIQGPGLPGREDWRAEFSLSHFRYLWDVETKRRGIAVPELVVRYPYLAGGRPQFLPGIAELVSFLTRPDTSDRRFFARRVNAHSAHERAATRSDRRMRRTSRSLAPASRREGRTLPREKRPAQQEEVQDTVVVATMDAFHHGIGYGDLPEEVLAPAEGGLELARQCIAEGLALLHAGDYWGYNQQCVQAKSDGRDVGQLLRYLLGPLEGRILDIVADDMTAAYNKPAPTWVAGALIEMQPASRNLSPYPAET